MTSRRWCLCALGAVVVAVSACGGGAASRLPGSAVWSANMETGDLSQWTRGGAHGGSFDSGACTRPASGVSTRHAHRGRFSMEMTIATSSGSDAGCRQFRHEESLSGKTYYYGAWYYVPRHYAAENYWNIFQFKSETQTLNDPFWVLDLMPRNRRGSGQRPPLRLLLRWKGTVVGPFSTSTRAGTRYYDQTVANVPVRRWFHIQVYLRQSSEFAGRIAVWQDGRKLWDLREVKTKYPDGDERWSVNNYSDGIRPSPTSLFVDDATVSTRRLAP